MTKEPPGESIPGQSERLTALMYAYEIERQEDTSYRTMQATFVSLALTAAAVLGNLLTRVCGVFEQGVSPTNDGPTCIEVPPGFLAAMPLLLLAFFAYLASNGLRATIRSYYLRALEREIATELGPDAARLASFKPAGRPATRPLELSFPRSSELSLIASATSVRRPGVARVFGLLAFAVIILSFIGFVAIIFAAVDLQYKLLMVGVYLPMSLLILGQAKIATEGGRRYFQRAVWALNNSLERDLHPADPPVRKTVSLRRYLLLPRPDALLKTFIPPVTFLMVTAAVGVPWSQAGRQFWWVVYGTLVFELLVYQARYQLNDIRGLSEDLDNHAAEVRSRLPVGKTPASQYFAIRTSQAVIAVRLYAAFALAWFFPNGLRALSYAAFVAVIVLTIAYEALKWTYNRSVPSGLQVLRTAGIYLLAWAGYALRGLFGVLAAAEIPPAPWTSQYGSIWNGEYLATVPGAIWICAVGAALGYGMMIVPIAWALDGVSQVDSRGVEQVKEDLCRARPNVAYAFRFVPKEGLSQPPKGTKESSGIPALVGPGSPAAPWNLGLAVGLASAFSYGGLMVWPSMAAPWIGAATGAATAILLAVSGRAGRRDFTLAITLLSLAAAGVAFFRSNMAFAAGIGTFLPAAVVAWTYYWLVNSSYHQLKSTPGKVPEKIGEFAEGVVNWVFGRGAAEIVQAKRRASITGVADDVP